MCRYEVSQKKIQEIKNKIIVGKYFDQLIKSLRDESTNKSIHILIKRFLSFIVVSGKTIARRSA